MALLSKGDELDGVVGLAVEEYFQLLERGERPQLDDFTNRYPDIRDLLKSVIPVLQAAEPAAETPPNEPFDSQRYHKQLGDFRILRQIGRGGMGIVYEAEQISMARRVALKVLPLAGLVDELKIRRFQNEVRAVAALDHPNIVTVYMVGEERGVHYYAMQLIRGRSLAEVISSLRQLRDAGDKLNGSSICHFMADSGEALRDKTFPHETVVRADSSTIPHSSGRDYYRNVVILGIQAATALQHAHEQGVVHRDIKPANLLLDSESQLHITDFGLARIESDVGVTMTGDLIGTLRYMAPEQALAKRVVVDQRADVYSLAATLYELLTLRPVYLAEDRQQLLKQIAFEDPTPLRRVDPDIPTELETIIHKAMSKDMERRYASALELADDLQAHLASRPIKAKPPTVSEIVGKWTRRNPVPTLAAIVTLSLVSLTLAVSMFFVSTAERKAKQARDELATQNSELARRNYLLHVASADQALLDRRYVIAQTELDLCPFNQRGWEWQFLSQRLRDVFPLRIPGGFDGLATDGHRMVVRGTPHSWDHQQFTIWDLGKRRVLHELRHDTLLWGGAISADGQWLAAGDRANKFMVWNADTGQERWRIDIHDKAGRPDEVKYNLAFSPDGTLIAAVYEHGRILALLDATCGEEKFRWGPFDDSPGKASFSPDGRWLAFGMGLGKGPAMIINTATGKIANAFADIEGHMYPIFDPSGQRIATAHVDGSIHLWSWDGRELNATKSWAATDVHAHDADRQIYRIAFSSDGRRLVSADRTNKIKVWNSITGDLLATLVTRGAIYAVHFRSSGPADEDEEILLSGPTLDVHAWRWRAGEGGIVAQPLAGAVEAEFSPDGQSVLATTPMYFTGGAAYYHRHPYYPPESGVILSAESGATIATIDETIYGASWSIDGQEIIAMPATGAAIRTFDAQTGKPTSRSFSGHTGRFTIARAAPARNRLVSFSTDLALRVFDYETGQKVLERQLSTGKQYWGTTAGFSPDAGLLLAKGHVIRTQQESEVRLQGPPRHWGKGLAFTRDGKRVYLGFSGGVLAQFDTANGQELKRFLGHSGYVRAIAISPNQQYIVGGDTHGRAIVWDVASGQSMLTLTAGNRIITSLDWSSDGRRIAAGKEDGTVQIWTLPISPGGTEN